MNRLEGNEEKFMAKTYHTHMSSATKRKEKAKEGPFYFDVIIKDKFVTKVKYCSDIFKLSDNFISFDSMDETNLNITFYDQYLYNIEEIKAVLSNWADKIQEKSACTSYIDTDIRSILLLCDRWIIRQCTPRGYEISGERIYHIQKRRDQEVKVENKKLKAEVKKKEYIDSLPYTRPKCFISGDRDNLNSACTHALLQKFDIKYRHVQTSYEKHVKALKRLLSWSDINKSLRSSIPKKQQQLDIPWIKKLWINPSTPIKRQRY